MSCGWAGPRMEQVTAHTEPKEPTQLHTLNPGLIPGLPGRKEGAAAREGAWKWKRQLPFQVIFPLPISLDTAELLTAAPPGARAWLRLWRENQYQRPQRRHNSLRTCLWIVFVLFSKRKDLGSESSGEIEQRVVPMEPGAVSGCSSWAQNLK